MSNFEAYSFLLANIFVSSLILPIQGQIAFTAMKIFGGYNMLAATLLSALGVMLAAIFNYYIGRLILIATMNKYGSAKNEKLDKTIYQFKHRFYFILLLAFIPIVGGTIATLAGFSRVGVTKLLLMSFLGALIYYKYFGLYF